ncbi:FAD-dependent monooxygenase [Pedobacter sp. PAMC26386]|nr:FAD-dependent monooxygenase [Pedobacter sp. PAMC26386]
MDKNINVAIIGAGLGGLALAQGLKKNNISFQVFERDLAVDSRTQGYRIRIDETGQKALYRCLPKELYSLFLDSCAVPAIGVRTLNSQLENLVDKWVDSWSDGQEKVPDLRANRLTLREILLSDIDEQVNFSKEFVNYEELPDGKVRVYFKDRTFYQADLVVAADGFSSKLCAIRFPTHQIVDTGHINIYGKTFYSDRVKKQVAKELQTGTSVIFEQEIALVIDAMQFKENTANLQLSAKDDYIYWAFIGNPNCFGLNQKDNLILSPESISQYIKNLTHFWAPSLKKLFEFADPKTLTITPVRTSFPNETWTGNSITALGDAIHTMSPASGLGANSALYDAAILAENLSEEINLKDAIADYESKMIEHSRNAIHASNQGGQKLYASQSDETLSGG